MQKKTIHAHHHIFVFVQMCTFFDDELKSYRKAEITNYFFYKLHVYTVNKYITQIMAF